MSTELYPAHEQAASEVARLAPGDIYPFARFAELCRAPLDSNEVRFCRVRMLQVLRGRGINLRPIRGQGYLRLTESERVRRQVPLARERVRRVIESAARDMMTVDVDQLEPADVRKLAEQQSRIGAMRAFMRVRAPQRYTLAKLPEVPKLGPA